MKLVFEPATSRLPRWPLWAVAIVLLYLAMVAMAVNLSVVTGRSVDLCLFKRLTSHACAACGTTRGVLALLGGHPVRAWLFNPMMMTAMAIAAAVLTVRLLAKRRMTLSMPPRQRKLLGLALLLMVLINWMYLLARGI